MLNITIRVGVERAQEVDSAGGGYQCVAELRKGTLGRLKGRRMRSPRGRTRRPVV